MWANEIGKILSKYDCYTLGIFNKKYIRKKIKCENRDEAILVETALNLLERFSDFARQIDRANDPNCED
jgi:hypothetical protein